MTHDFQPFTTRDGDVACSQCSGNRRSHQITIDKNGVIEFVSSEELAPLRELGPVEKRRASHIEPCSLVLRLFFHIVRRCVTDDSRIAEITRRWPCRWRVNLTLSDGPTFGSFTDRKRAIAAEIEWLRRHVL